MTPWEYSAAISGWAKAHGSTDEKNTYPTEDEFRSALERHG